MTEKLQHHRHKIRAAAILSIPTALAFIAALILYTVICATMVLAPPGTLPDTAEREHGGVISTVAPDTIENVTEIEIRTKIRDWKPFRTILANDVRQQGGWVGKTSSGESRYYVPEEYLTRAAPLIEASGERPYHTRYNQWALNAVGQADEPTPGGRTVNAILVVKHTIPISDHLAGRIMLQTLLGGAAASGVMFLMLMPLSNALEDRAAPQEQKSTRGTKEATPLGHWD